jgi:hypothetical protein
MPTGLAAVRFTPVTAKGDEPNQPIPGTRRMDHVTYTWYFTPNHDAKHFAGDEVVSGHGEVHEFEAPANKLEVTRPYVEISSLDLVWRVGNWLRYPRTGNVAFASTTASNIEEVNPAAPQLLWIERE